MRAGGGLQEHATEPCQSLVSVAVHRLDIASFTLFIDPNVDCGRSFSPLRTTWPAHGIYSYTRLVHVVNGQCLHRQAVLWYGAGSAGRRREEVSTSDALAFLAGDSRFAGMAVQPSPSPASPSPVPHLGATREDLNMSVDYPITFLPDSLLPEEFSALFESHHLRPAQRLQVAVLAQALDMVKYAHSVELRKRALFREAHQWMQETDSDWPFSFVAICEVLHLSPTAVREAVGRRVRECRDLSHLRSKAISRHTRLTCGAD